MLWYLTTPSFIKEQGRTQHILNEYKIQTIFLVKATLIFRYLVTTYINIQVKKKLNNKLSFKCINKTVMNEVRPTTYLQKSNEISQNKAVDIWKFTDDFNGRLRILVMLNTQFIELCRDKGLVEFTVPELQ